MICILFNSTGLYVVCQINKLMMHHEVMQILRHGYRKSEFSTIFIRSESEPGFQRLSNDEFLYKGNRYDIVYEFRFAKMLVFKCVNDKFEDFILHLIQKTGKQQSHKNQLLRHLIVRALTTDHRLFFISPCQEYHYPVQDIVVHGIEPVPSPHPPNFIQVRDFNC